MKKKILIISSIPLDKNNRRLLHILGKFKNSELFVISSGLISLPDNIKFNFFNLNFLINQKFFFTIIKLNFLINFLAILLISLRYKPKIIYTIDPHFHFISVLIKIILGIDNYYLDIRENPKVHRIYYDFFLKKYSSHVDKVYTNSINLKNLLKKRYYFNQIEIDYTFPSFDYNKYSNLNKKYKNDDLRLCFFGDIKPNRLNREFFLSFLKSYQKNFIFDVYGKIYDKKFFALSKKFSFLNFKGEVDYKIIPKKLSNYHYAVMFNKPNFNSKYTIPGKFWEYISCGIPILTNGRPSLNTYIKKNNLGFIIKNFNFENFIFSLKKKNIFRQQKINCRKFFNIQKKKK